VARRKIWTDVRLGARLGGSIPPSSTIFSVPAHNNHIKPVASSLGVITSEYLPHFCSLFTKIDFGTAMYEILVSINNSKATMKLNFFSSNVLFFGSLFAGSLHVQLTKWEKYAGTKFKIVLLVLFTSQILAITGMFNKLPENSMSLVLDNIFEPMAFVCGLIMLVFLFALTFYTLAVAKLTKSIIG